MLLHLWSMTTTSGLELLQENFRLVFTGIRIAKHKSRRPKKAAEQLLLDIFQEDEADIPGVARG